jgi:hypothetical protein
MRADSAIVQQFRIFAAIRSAREQLNGKRTWIERLDVRFVP